MIQRYTNIVIVVFLAAALVVLAGCERAKSTEPIPTAAAKVVGTQPAATGIPTSVGAQVTTLPASPVPISPIATPTPPPTAAPVPLPTQPPLPGGQTTYIVQPGDWLWKIAREKGVSAQAIAAVNPGIDVNRLYPGQKLIIPAPGSPPSGGATPVPSGTGQIVHTVQAGENLFRVALKYNRTVQSVAVANGIRNVHLIYPGQKLVIP